MAVVAVQVRHHRFTDALKRRPDIRVVRVTEGTRDALPERLMERLVGGTPPREGAVTGASAPGLEAAARAKRAVRERVWARLETDHDFRLDVIVAGEEVITCRRARRPKGLLWDHLDAARIAAIPALAALAARAPGRADG